MELRLEEEQEQEERSHKTLMILHSSPLFEENDNYLRLEKTYKTHQKVTLIAFTRQMFPFHTKLPITYKASYRGLLYLPFPIVLLSSMSLVGVIVSTIGVSDARYLTIPSWDHH